MIWIGLIPLVSFCLLVGGEAVLGRRTGSPRHSGWDWVLNLSGFFFQGAVIPYVGYFLATAVIPAALPGGARVLELGWAGAFLLSFVGVDFVYYWQHRWFHRSRFLWELHRCHHAARRVDVWVTSRNTVVVHFVFVYLLVNPFLGYLVTEPAAFFAGAAATAALDLARHANIDYSKIPGSAPAAAVLGKLFVLPAAHHQHHATEDIDGNFGANLIVWDRMFGTLLPRDGYPAKYGVKDAPHPARQLLFPFLRRLTAEPRPGANTAATPHAPEAHRDAPPS